MSSLDPKTAMPLQLPETSFPQQPPSPHPKDGALPRPVTSPKPGSSRRRRATATLLLCIVFTIAFIYTLVMVERSIRANGCMPGASTRSRFRLPCETGRHYPLTTAADWQSLSD
ncbi:hypothetical protein V8F20_012339 [Naviculisporaceae sp. PSN 640]